MPEQLTSTAPFVEELSSPENLQRIVSVVKEIFEVMFGLTVDAETDSSAPRPPREADERTAIVGFSGSMRGSCQIRIGRAAAAAIASAMLGGAPLDDSDETIDDAFGELCNMLAGGWKNSISHLATGCLLSPPTIIAGMDYKIHMSKPSSRLARAFRFGEHSMDLTLYREESAA